MNIQQAKDYIKNDIRLYLKKDEYGEYRIPLVRQRPIFLLGAPGIGKTAIMEQVASELNLALVSYSMTHHTRQSALGLPFIRHMEYEGMEYDVSEYTMSEIIASIYDVMRESGLREGILFLDEINCVSETLAPSMLQFLQYKVFGRHQVPEGWVIVTAGNPPEYNKSVRELDVVTLDRLKVLSVEADYATWRRYAVERGVHGAILNFLEIKKQYFYHMEMTAQGRSYVTARGWEDLSQMLKLYEEEELSVDETLVEQYIRNDRIVKEFTAYYDMYNKYKKNYPVEAILDGTAGEETTKRGQKATFDERLSVLGMLMDTIQTQIQEAMGAADELQALLPPLRSLREQSQTASVEALSKTVAALEGACAKRMDSLAKANALSPAEKRQLRRRAAFWQEAAKQIDDAEEATKDTVKAAKDTAKEAFAGIRENFETQVEQLRGETKRIQERLHNLFTYVGEAFAGGNELLLLVTELTVNTNSARFISQFGCEDYQKASDTLMLTERQSAIQEEIRSLDL